MGVHPISTKVAQETPIDDLMKQLDTTPEGLSNEEVRRRVERFGANEIEEKSASALVKLDQRDEAARRIRYLQALPPGLTGTPWEARFQQLLEQCRPSD